MHYSKVVKERGVCNCNQFYLEGDCRYKHRHRVKSPSFLVFAKSRTLFECSTWSRLQPTPESGVMSSEMSSSQSSLCNKRVRVHYRAHEGFENCGIGNGSGDEMEGSPVGRCTSPSLLHSTRKARSMVIGPFPCETSPKSTKDTPGEGSGESNVGCTDWSGESRCPAQRTGGQPTQIHVENTQGTHDVRTCVPNGWNVNRGVLCHTRFSTDATDFGVLTPIHPPSPLTVYTIQRETYRTFLRIHMTVQLTVCVLGKLLESNRDLNGACMDSYEQRKALYDVADRVSCEQLQYYRLLVLGAQSRDHVASAVTSM